MPPRIGIIGAGSAVFSLSLVRDLCLTPNLAGATVSLMDVSPERLDAIVTLCRRYAEESGARLTVEQTTDRRACMAGCDFVVNTALVTGWGDGVSAPSLSDRVVRALAMIEEIESGLPTDAPERFLIYNLREAASSEIADACYRVQSLARIARDARKLSADVKEALK